MPSAIALSAGVMQLPPSDFLAPPLYRSATRPATRKDLATVRSVKNLLGAIMYSGAKSALGEGSVGEGSGLRGTRLTLCLSGSHRERLLRLRASNRIWSKPSKAGT